MNIVGRIEFDNRLLDVYRSLDEPLFRATDISDLLGLSEGNAWKMVKMCEEDEVMNLPIITGGQTRRVTFVTETGLYNILNQSRSPAARRWREEQRINAKLINTRKSKGMTIVDQFNIWEDMRKTNN